MVQQSVFGRFGQKLAQSWENSRLRQSWWAWITVFVLAAYSPFMGHRIMRVAGDDKVYVSQAVEMARDGRWFIQTLQDVPDYYKGPLHYLLLRLGMGVFGYSMWATLYMNLLFALLGGLSIAALFKRHRPERLEWGVFCGISFAVCAGIFSHSFASQMEVQLAGLFLVGLFLLDSAKTVRGDLIFWLLAGLVGWSKSPLHSALLGVSALLLWGWRGELLYRLKSVKHWLTVWAGVVLCIAGYMPAALNDYDNFYSIFIMRENLMKPANGGPWHEALVSVMLYSLWPLVIPAVVSYIDGLMRRFKDRSWGHVWFSEFTGDYRLFQLGFCLALPTIVFFVWHPYRGHNYAMPVIGGVMMCVCAIWMSTRNEVLKKLYRIALWITGIAIVALPLFVTALSARFDPVPEWWWSGLTPMVWILCGLSIFGFIVFGPLKNQLKPVPAILSLIGVYWTLGTMMVIIGEREMFDLKKYLQTKTEAVKEGSGSELKLSYYNLQTNIWSEWGYLNFMVGTPIRGIHNPDQLKENLEQKRTILVPGQEHLKRLMEFAAKETPHLELKNQSWKRWKTRGRNYDGLTPWQAAWKRREYGPLEKDFFIVEVYSRDHANMLF